MTTRVTMFGRTGLVSAGLLLGFACGEPGGPMIEASRADFDAIVSQYGDWNGGLADTASAPPVSLAQTVLTAGNNENWVCQNVQLERRRNLDELLMPGSAAGILWPGALIQGASLIDGTPAGLPLPRSPITVSIDLGVEHPSAHVANPTSASVQEAVAALQREADSRLGVIDVVPARVQFEMTEAHQFRQVMLDVGSYAQGSVPTAMLGISVPGTVSLGVEVKAGVSVSFERHTIAVKLIQPMYTISFADEEKLSPGDFLDPAITDAQLRDVESRGMIGPNNLPTYVKSVTYGRMVLYTMTNTTTATAAELQSATQAALDLFNRGVGSGGSKLSARDSMLLQNSEVRIVAFGGSQDSALAAIRTGELGKFFTAVPATQAVALAYRINYLKNGRVATLGMGVTYTRSDCSPVGSNVRYWHITLESLTSNGGCDSTSYFRFAEVAIATGPGVTTEYPVLGATGPMRDTTVNRTITLRLPLSPAGFYVRNWFFPGTGAGDGQGECNGIRTGLLGQALCQSRRDFTAADQFAVNPFTFKMAFTLPGNDAACTVTFTYKIATEPAFSPPALPGTPVSSDG